MNPGHDFRAASFIGAVVLSALMWAGLIAFICGLYGCTASISIDLTQPEQYPYGYSGDLDDERLDKILETIEPPPSKEEKYVK